MSDIKHPFHTSIFEVSSKLDINNLAPQLQYDARPLNHPYYRPGLVARLPKNCNSILYTYSENHYFEIIPP